MTMAVVQRLRPHLRPERAAPWLAMLVIVALGWAYMIGVGANLAPMQGGTILTASLVMWIAMMAAMMLPSTVPAVSVFMMLAGRRCQPAAGRMTAMFIAGYVLVWTGFSIPAAIAQWGLTNAALLSPMGESISTALSATILVAAGLYQFTALKTACATKCRTPFAFLMQEWRDGMTGALVVGLRHGAYCLGCCWALMAILFVVGTMNLVWMVGLTIIVALEKLVPLGRMMSRARGSARVIAGLATWLAGGSVAQIP